MSVRTCMALVALGWGVLGVGAGEPALAREEVAKLLPGDAPGGGSGFGKSLSISGDYAVVGAPNDGDLGQDAGAVYVFEWDGVAWVQRAKLIASNGGGGGLRGFRVD